MHTWVTVIIIWTLALCSLIGLQTFRLDRAQSKIELREQAYETLMTNYSNAIASVGELRRNKKALIDQQVGNIEKQRELEKTASTHLQTIRRLQHEIQELRDWANTPLPGAIISLHRHTTFFTAADYHQHVQYTGAVHNVRPQPPDERGIKSGS